MAKSFTQLTTMFTTLAQNATTANQTLAGILLNDTHRYLLMRFFDNERSMTMLTIGPQTLTLFATPSVGDSSATLSVAWPTNYVSCQQLVVFSDGEQRTVSFTQGLTAITWQSPLTGKNFATTAVIAAGATSATLATAWATATQSSTASFSDGTTKTITFTQGSATITWVGGLSQGVGAFVNVIPTGANISCVGVQSYPLPANVSKLKNSTLTIGQLVYTAAPIQSIQEWTRLNALPYNSSWPAYFFVFNNSINFWPIPAASGELLTLYCQISVADMTYQDYTTPGTIASSGLVVNSNQVTGSSTTWNTTGKFPIGTDLTFANIFFTANPPQGDGLLYQVQSVQSETGLTLVKPVVNVPLTTGGGTLSIGQYPLLSPDFHDAIVYGALRTYFSSIAKDTDKAGYFTNLYNEKLEQMKYYLGTKQVNVDLGATPIQSNPNLYILGT